MATGTLTIHGDVGASTGEVRHDGDILVLGSVRAGLRVEAAGCVSISRDVRGAEILAGGDVIIHGIATGPDLTIDAVGSVTVRHLADARVVAGLDIDIRAVAERCELVAGRRIAAVGNPGIIRGGLIRPGRVLQVRRLLGSGGRAAVVRVGYPPFAENRDELLSRLSFARARARPPVEADSSRLIRRQVAETSAFRSLLSMLDRRLRQIDRAAEEDCEPEVRVLDHGPVEARIFMDGEERRPDGLSAEEAKRVG